MSPSRSDDDYASSSQNAFMSLHSHAGTVHHDLGASNDLTAAHALSLLTEAPDATDSARFDVLAALAKADFPDYADAEVEYHALAAKIGADHGLSAEQLLTDLKTEAHNPGTIHASESGTKLPHHITAFYGRDVCNTARIEVGPLPGTWIFSEFETDASFEDVAEWVNPHNWPERGPMMFKSMKPVGGEPTSIPGVEAGIHWHGVFHEEVQLVERLNTLLHCDYIEIPGAFAGVSYQLTESLDKQINVDRGFLLVNELGATRHVKALKVVGFTTSFWDEVATWVCPLWTDFVRGAVQGGSSSRPSPPTPPPGGGTTPADVAASWVRFMAEASQRYTTMGVDWMERASQPGYGSDGLVRDGAKYWLALARDWSEASMLGYQSLQQLAGESGATAAPTPLIPPLATAPETVTDSEPNLDNEVFVPGAAGKEGTTMPITGLVGNESITSTGLIRLGANRDEIAAADIQVTNEKIADDMFGARIEVTVENLNAGLYIGEVEIGTGPNSRREPIQLYISRAKEVNSGGG